MKDELTSKFEESTRVVETLIIKNLNESLQMKKDEINVELK